MRLIHSKLLQFGEQFLKLTNYSKKKGKCLMLRPKPINVKPLENYFLSIVFDNGENKVFDVKPLIRGKWFSELKSKSVFETVKVSESTVEWINGQDICPDDLYYLSK